MKRRRVICLCIIFHFASVSRICAQQPGDSALLAISVSNLQQFYFSEIGNNAQIYHGAEYIRNGLKAIGFPYFESDKMISGSVSYQGTTYPDRDLFYNIVSDEMIINDYPGDAKISLSPQKADSFRIGSHFFVYLIIEKFNNLPQDGYYEQLFAGEPGVYARRTKRLISGTGTEDPTYYQYDDYFIRLKNIYYLVDGKTALLELMNDKKEVLKKYIRTNKLNFKKNFQSFLLMTTIYYSQLKP